MLGRIFGHQARLSKTATSSAASSTCFAARARSIRTFLDELEKRLYLADVGTQATHDIVDRVRQAFRDKEITGDVEAFVKQQLRDLLDRTPPGISYATARADGRDGRRASTARARRRRSPSSPSVCKSDGKKVLVAACDTFRAAAVEQLTIWAGRIGCEIVKKGQGSDPAAVAHDACEKAKARGFDVLIVDTAGRLHTQTHLMKELEKIHRVVSQADPRGAARGAAGARRHRPGRTRSPRPSSSRRR